MQYFKAQWRHDALGYPVEIWSELDADRFETRKMERDAAGNWKCWSTAHPEGLGTVPVPALVAIEQEAEFTAVEIDRAAFKKTWQSVWPA